jgi:nucleoside-diphosphate-sugar epimerase
MTKPPLKVLVLGVNGFIGTSLASAVLASRDWDLYGMDVAAHKLGDLVDHPRMHFVEGDVTINHEWIEYNIKKCDVVLPLVAIANPTQYGLDPLRVFELDFEANLQIVRRCVAYKKRLLFPSTSEVYGMCPDPLLDEHTSTLVYGPIEKQRWIYAASKQLLDRVIYAHGVRDGLDYTLFRPFNWVGPHLDNVLEPKEGSSRLFTQFISNVIHGKPLQLVDGGRQRRSFTYIDDAIDCLMRIIENKDGVASRQIINIGNPANDVSVEQLARLILEVFSEYPDFKERAARTKLVPVTSEEYFGKSYQDILARVPAIEQAHRLLGWQPTTDLRTAIRLTLDYHLSRNDLELG